MMPSETGRRGDMMLTMSELDRPMTSTRRDAPERGDQLTGIPLLAGLSDVDADAFARRCAWRTYDANELVIDYEDESTDVRFVLSGRLRVILRIAAGREMILAEIGTGAHFGEIAAIDDAPRSANVTALTPSRLCIMPQAVFHELITRHTDVNIALLRELSGRVRSLNTRLSEHSFLQTRHRLYCELLRLSRPRAIDPSQRAISPPPVQKDLAARIGSRREVVSREIAKLKREGIVEVTTGALVLKDVRRLNVLIDQGWEEC